MLFLFDIGDNRACLGIDDLLDSCFYLGPLVSTGGVSLLFEAFDELVYLFRRLIIKEHAMSSLVLIAQRLQFLVKPCQFGFLVIEVLVRRLSAVSAECRGRESLFEVVIGGVFELRTAALEIAYESCLLCGGSAGPHYYMLLDLLLARTA